MTTARLPRDVTSPALGTDAASDCEGDGVGRLGAWAFGLWGLVAAFAVVGVVGSQHYGIGFRDPHGRVFLSRVAWSAGIFAALSVLDAVARTRGSAQAGRAGRSGHRVQAIARTWRQRWTRRRLALVALALLAYHVTYWIYHNLKSWDVYNPPRDGMLLAWDRWLFLGHSPAVLLHDLLGQHVAAYVLMVVYESFSTVVTIAFVASLVTMDRLRDGYVFIVSAMWVWVLGTFCYYAIPSLGPFHSAPGEFAGLPHLMIQDTQATYMAQRARMLVHPEGHDAFAQVSAFASLHVALVTFLLLMALYYRHRLMAQVLGVYVLGTVVATVYLGWHFFVDDIAGAIIAVAGVGLGHLMVQPGGRPPGVARHGLDRVLGRRTA